MRPVALRSGSPTRTFESIYRRHVEDVYRYTLALLDRPADAEDATQTTFLNAYRALEQGERPRDSRAWLRAIALNVCREHYRRASRRPDEISLDDDAGELVLDPPTPAIGDVVRGLSQLPFNQRAALVMREFEGHSLAEIATALDVSASAVEALLFRARRGLREQLEGTLDCAEAEQAISRQLDGALPRGERGPLRAHLRQCPDCASLARRLRAQRSAIKSLAVIPLPASLKLGQLFGGGAAASAPAGAAATAAAGGSVGGPLLSSLAGSVVAKLAVATVIGATAVGVGYASLANKTSRPAAHTRSASNAEPHGAPGGAHVELSGRGAPARTTSRVLLAAPRKIAARSAPRRLSRRVATVAGTGSTRSGASASASASVPHVAPGNGHVSGTGVRAHGHRSPARTKAAPGTHAGGGGVGGSGGGGGGHPQPKPHKSHPTQSQGSKPQPPPTSATTTTSPPNPPNHGVGSGNGNGNGKH
jgi:RNA polymerase sigma factor (sigma-70 family)